MGSKSMQATVEAVQSEDPNGEFQLVLSSDDKDRDGDQLWADQWETLPPKIHMDTDHAWAKGQSVPFTAGSGAPTIDEDGRLVVKGTFAGTDHAQLTRQLLNEGHIWQASVSYSEHEHDDGSITRELLNGTFTGVPANPNAVVLASKSLGSKEAFEAFAKAAADAEHSLAGLDAILDEAVKLTVDIDREGLPEPVGQALDLLVAAQHQAGCLMNEQGVYDPDNPKNKGKDMTVKNKAQKWLADHPLNNANEVREAWSELHQEKATDGYSQTEVSSMIGKIRSAARRFDVQLDGDNSKELLDVACKSLGMMVLDGKLKNFPTQSTPGNTVATDDVGAQSVYDADVDEEDDGSDDASDGPDPYAQALHDAAVSLAADVCPGCKDAASVASVHVDVVPDISAIQKAINGLAAGGNITGIADALQTLVADGATKSVGTLQVPLSIVTAGPVGKEMYSIFANGHAVAHGELKDLVEAQTKDQDPGRPTGPYQGVEGMSGVNASGTDPGKPAEGLFQEGVAGVAVPPQFKDQATPDNNSEQPQTSPPAEPSADEAAAADHKSAAAVTPADVAARHKARLRAFEFQAKATKVQTER